MENNTRYFVEPLAIIGHAFRLPQEAVSIKGFMDMLDGARCASTDFPTDRFHIDAFYRQNGKRHEDVCLIGFVRVCLHLLTFPSFLCEEGTFCVKISQHLMPNSFPLVQLMQHAWIHSKGSRSKLLFMLLRTVCSIIIISRSHLPLITLTAGLSLDAISGSKTSVYLGSFTNDYRDVLFSDPLQDYKHGATGLSGSMLANRVSWFYNLRGPSLQLDTACSSSLTALHQACQSILSGESSMVNTPSRLNAHFLRLMLQI